MIGRCPVARDWRMLVLVIGYARSVGPIPVPRKSLLLTNPILAAPAIDLASFADRRISAGFIVEAATGTTDHLLVPKPHRARMPDH